MANKLKQFLSVPIRNAFFSWIKNGVNKYYYNFSGIRRSGNHALIHWVLDKSKGSSIFCNDLWKNQNPKNASMKKCGLGRPGRSNMIVSYEDRVIENTGLTDDEAYIGKVKKRFYIIVLRDPFNLFASRMAWNFKQGEYFREHVGYRNKIVNLWKAQAHQYLKWNNEEIDDGINRIPINYNLWVSDNEYRKMIAGQLELTQSNSGVGEVKNYGGGSSFDRMTIEHGDKLNVLNRFEALKDDPVYQSIFHDDELIILSKEIFGTIKGTEMLYT